MSKLQVGDIVFAKRNEESPFEPENPFVLAGSIGIVRLFLGVNARILVEWDSDHSAEAFDNPHSNVWWTYANNVEKLGEI